MTEQYEYVPHRLLRRRVRDIASGVEGVLMAVINENVSDSAVYERWVELAYIRGASGREFTTAASNVEPAPDQPRTTVGRRDLRSA
ncbi:hypothetical protein EF910_34365 [Streptomyces sp. WAC07149]|uniref:hypothetical protein n=1 Tax=Streptomyces sp. WAC07149 TaxID=2487425 RepID=UPI000F787561|nr:hypothetical protein [Streptomyces sp. WAC07149]RSS99804.1 hypothetical protein EF910_34365 [Streptomyces sp. WAC07149]